MGAYMSNTLKIDNFKRNRKNKNLSQQLIINYNEQRLIVEGLNFVLANKKDLSQQDRYDIEFLIGDLE
jgi:hypothetical protein